MSRSNNTDLINPAVRFFEWDGDNGHFKYYDKATEKRVNVELPFTFLVLDRLTTIAGFSKNDNSGFWANEVRDTKKDTLVVKTKKGKVFEGSYDELKTKSITGAKYCQSVYIAFKEGKDLKIGNIKMVGASLGPWIDFGKKNKIYEGAVTVKEKLQGQVGKIIFQSPVFKLIATTEESNNTATELDKELQSYLEAYLKKNRTQKQDEEVLSEAAKEANSVADEEFGDGRTGKQYREDHIMDDEPPADMFIREDEFNTPSSAKKTDPPASVEDDGLPF